VGLESGASQLLRWCANCELAAHRSAKAIAKSDMRVSTPFTDNDVVESSVPSISVYPCVSTYIGAVRMTTTGMTVSRPRKENDDDSRSLLVWMLSSDPYRLRPFVRQRGLWLNEG
jgi:hypothetical protein